MMIFCDPDDFRPIWHSSPGPTATANLLSFYGRPFVGSQFNSSLLATSASTSGAAPTVNFWYPLTYTGFPSVFKRRVQHGPVETNIELTLAPSTTAKIYLVRPGGSVMPRTSMANTTAWYCPIDTLMYPITSYDADYAQGTRTAEWNVDYTQPDVAIRAGVVPKVLSSGVASTTHNISAVARPLSLNAAMRGGTEVGVLNATDASRSLYNWADLAVLDKARRAGWALLIDVTAGTITTNITFQGQAHVESRSGEAAYPMATQAQVGVPRNHGENHGNCIGQGPTVGDAVRDNVTKQLQNIASNLPPQDVVAIASHAETVFDSHVRAIARHGDTLPVSGMVPVSSAHLDEPAKVDAHHVAPTSGLLGKISRGAGKVAGIASKAISYAEKGAAFVESAEPVLGFLAALL